MPTDEPGEEIPGDGRGRSGRHAGRRKSLLQRLHMPVGKVVALAAMPSAVILGTGFTSPLAKADQQQEAADYLADYDTDSCTETTDSDQQNGDRSRETEDTQETEETEETEEPEETEKAEDDAEQEQEQEEDSSGRQSTEDDAAGSGQDDQSSDTSGQSGGDDQSSGTDQEDSGSGSGASSGTGDSGDSGDGDSSDEDSGDSSDEDSGSSGGALDGIGEGLQDIGDAVGDLLTPGDGEQDDQAEDDGAQDEGAEDDESQETDDSGSQDGQEDSGQAGDAATGDTGDSGDTGESGDDSSSSQDGQDTGEEAGGQAQDGADQEEQEPSAEPSASASADEEDSTATEDESQAEDESQTEDEEQAESPCPEEKKVAGTDEQTSVTLPNDSWYMEASSLTLYDLDYHGVVNVTTADGTTKQVLKFTAERIDIVDMHQIVDGEGSVRRHVATEEGSTSTFRNGTVTMYTERISGKLFGLVNVTYDAEHEPPLDLPRATFTDVFLTQAGQFGGELTMKGMSSYITNDGPTQTED